MYAVDRARLESAYDTALQALLAARHHDGYWVGELSTSALSTATAVTALALVQRHTAPHDRYAALIEGGLRWLAEHQNADGGWGDTVKSFSNISTTMLCRAAIHVTGAATRHAEALAKAERWLGERHGTTAPQLAEAVRARYGKDRTFSVPILTMCALAGLVSWDEVPRLPFELACVPQSWFRFLNLQVVSYALPALIAIGQAVHHHRRGWNPLTKLVRAAARRRSLKVLTRIQPTNGGFLEATPLTSFVTMSLASIGLADHEVARKGAEFIAGSVRPDGSWPIDTNLSTWVTTLSINALASVDELAQLDKKEELGDWLIRQQYRERHPYTGAEPGAWAWTDLPGGVPDADDTPGAAMALTCLRLATDHTYRFPWKYDAATWLLNVQNRDGGWPTFCRGWGRLPFDRSGPDLTAHAIRALLLLTPPDGELAYKIPPAVERGLAYLAAQQRPDGSWLPLWFGNQHAPDDINPTYGTARVLAVYRQRVPDGFRQFGLTYVDEAARRGVAWLLSAQNPDGGWGGDAGTPSSVEETALAVEVLIDAGPEGRNAAGKGVRWLIERVEAGGLHEPTPIGFYFAKLWYYEKLYPIIFAVGALGRARRYLTAKPQAAEAEVNAATAPPRSR